MRNKLSSFTINKICLLKFQWTVLWPHFEMLKQMKITASKLSKIEQLFKELEIKIRYEKGSFQGGYALVENRQMVVLNKFVDTQSKGDTLIEILNLPDINLEKPLSNEAQNLLNQLLKNKN